MIFQATSKFAVACVRLKLGKSESTDLPGQDVKLTSHMNFVLRKFQRVQGANRDYYSHILLNFQSASKSGIVYVKIVLIETWVCWIYRVTTGK